MGPDSSSGRSIRAARPKFSPNGRAGVRAAAVIALLGMIGILGLAAAGATQLGPAPQIGQPAPDFTAMAQTNGAVWLTVISSAPGKQGYVNGPAADALTQSRKALPSAVLLDPSGAVGHLYAAKTTPHMFVIDKNGTLQYMGGMDSLATTDEADIARAEPYLKEAMLAVVQGKPVAHSVSKPYGCSIKY
jgi:hypothetical protein